MENLYEPTYGIPEEDEKESLTREHHIPKMEALIAARTTPDKKIHKHEINEGEVDGKYYVTTLDVKYTGRKENICGLCCFGEAHIGMIPISSREKADMCSFLKCSHLTRKDGRDVIFVLDNVKTAELRGKTIDKDNLDINNILETIEKR